MLAVGSTVIDLTPTPLKEWAIRQFGSADKAVLVGSVVVVVLLLAAIAGVVADRRETVGLLILVGLAGVAGVLAVLRPESGPLDVVPALVAAVVAATSQLSSTRESVVLTPWPPGPLDRENRHPSSAPGMRTESLTRRSSTCPACHPRRAKIDGRRVGPITGGG